MSRTREHDEQSRQVAKNLVDTKSKRIVIQFGNARLESLDPFFFIKFDIEVFTLRFI